MLFTLRSAFVQTLEAKAVLELAQADLEYYDKIIDISKARYQGRRSCQIDLTASNLLRVQYESEIQTAIVNLRTAEDRAAATPRRPHARGPVRCDWPVRLYQRPQAAHRLRTGGAGCASRPARSHPGHRAVEDQPQARDISNGSTDPTFGAWYTWNASTTTPMRLQTLGLSVNIPLRVFDRNQGEKQRTLIDIDRNDAVDRRGPRAGLQRCGLCL
jgi:cobalt-zinc-cadmium efflux system outer membrane protein